MAESNTTICNQALAGLGSLRINNFEDATENSPQARQCRLHFEPTRDALIRSHSWRFAAARESLSKDTVDPPFEYDSQFILPNDFMAGRSVFGDNFTTTEDLRLSYALEGDRLLTNETSIDLRYTKKVTDASKFDPLFVKVLVLELQDAMIGPLAGGDERIQKKIDRKLLVVMRFVRAMDRNETNTIGRLNHRPWVESHVIGGGTSFRSRV